MRILLHLAILTLLTGTTSKAAFRKPSDLAPHWQAELPLAARSDSPALAVIRTTPQLLLLQSSTGKTLVALSRRDGAERWRRGAASSLAGPAGGGDTWRILGYGPAPSGVVLLLRDNTWVEAVAEATGRPFWQERLPPAAPGAPGIYPCGVYGGLLLLTQGTGAQTRALFRDAATGDVVDPSTEPGRQALRKAAALHGAPFAAVELADVQPYLLDLRRGELRQLPAEGLAGRKADRYHAYGHLGYLAPDPVFLADDRVVALFDMDDDGAGHSGWPKYVMGMCLQGKPVWRFPRVFTSADRYGQVAAPASRIQRVFHPTASRNLVAQDASERLYGIRPRDGSVAWSKRLASLRVIDLAATGNGFYLLAKSEHPAAAGADHASLAHVTADTGRIRWLAGVPAATKLVASGEDVCLLTADRVLDYRASDLTARR